MRELFRFLEVDESFEPDMSGPHNAAFSVRSPAINRWFSRPSAIREQAKRFLPAAARPLWDRVASANRRWNVTIPPPLGPRCAPS